MTAMNSAYWRNKEFSSLMFEDLVIELKSMPFMNFYTNLHFPIFSNATYAAMQCTFKT